jgi:hypothetical protein
VLQGNKAQREIVNIASVTGCIVIAGNDTV